MPVWTPATTTPASFRGPTPLRVALEQSLNTVTARLGAMLGMEAIGQTIESFGIMDHMPREYSMALGAGETTPLRHTAAYAMLVNGGKKHHPDPDRPRAGPQRQDDLSRRPAAVRRLRQCRVEAPAGAGHPRHARADRRSARSTFQIVTDDAGRGAARHRHRGQGGRQADRRQDRHDQRLARRLVRRLHPRSRRRRLYRLRRAGQPRRRRDRRPSSRRRSSATS